MSSRPIEPNLEELLRHASWLKNLALSLVKDPDQAEDMVQQTWVKALEHPPKTGGNTQGWLARVLRNGIYTRYRSEHRRLARESQVSGSDGELFAHEVVERGETSRLLVEALMRLDEPYRSTLLMRFHEDMAPKEIAQRMDVPAGTVRARLNRGLAKLRADIGQSWGKSWQDCHQALFVFAGIKPGASSTSPWILRTVVLLLVTTAVLVVIQPWAGADQDILATESPPFALEAVGGGMATDSEVPSSSSRTALLSSLTQNGGQETPAFLTVSGEVLRQSGKLRFGNSQGLAQEIPVTAGESSFEKSEQVHMLSPRFTAWFIPDHGFALEVQQVLLKEDTNGSVSLELDLGQTTEIKLQVTDYRGNAIPGAEFRIVGAHLPSDQSIQCDSAGVLQATVIGKFPLKLVVDAWGYGSDVIDIESAETYMQPYDAILGRYLAAGRVVDRRERATESGFGGGDYYFSHRSRAHADLLKQIESRAEMDREFEWVNWNLVVEKGWNEAAFTITRTHPDGLVPSETAVFPLKHILDPTLVPYRFPGEWVDELHPVDIRIAPVSKFIDGEFPPAVRFGWRLVGAPEDEAHIRTGHLLDKAEPVYRFYQPPGQYTVGISMNLDSPYPSFGATVIRVKETVVVEVGVDPPVEYQVELSEDQFYAGYVFQDDSGAPLTLAWKILEASFDSRTSVAFAGFFPEPKYRFFKLGTEYELFISPLSRGALEPTGIRTFIEAPAPGEILHFNISRPDLQRFRLGPQ
jgi:RNA polymerase sigma factor (sigma-70 family)